MLVNTIRSQLNKIRFGKRILCIIYYIGCRLAAIMYLNKINTQRLVESSLVNELRLSSSKSVSQAVSNSMLGKFGILNMC